MILRILELTFIWREKLKVEKLKYILENDAIAELFGRQNFSTKESAILELVKNSFDADSSICYIIFDTDTISIFDNGDGMNSEHIYEYWMHIGKSDKGYEKNGRILAGSKGVGRFALARLGNRVNLSSKTDSDKEIQWETNWISNELRSEIGGQKSKGTKITISQLRDKWTPKNKIELVEFLNRVTNSLKTSVFIKMSPIDEKIKISPISSREIRIGEECVSKIFLNYKADSTFLKIKIESDEFSERVVSKNITNYDINKYEFTLDIAEEFSPDIERGDITIEELKGIGSFKAEFYFSLSNTTANDVERFMYKHDRLFNQLNEGIILYRNAFSISSLEGKRDWLDLSARSRKSPASPSHPTGQWRVRANQLSGFVFIDKLENDKLVDLANRQGLEENDYYIYFKKIIDKGISIFEDYRQKIIRDIVKFQDELSPKKELTKPILQDFLKKPERIKRYDEKKLEQLTNEITAVKRSSEETERKWVESETNYRYDSRILNVLATQGLKAESMAHEFRADRATLGNNYKLIVDALKKFGFWKILQSEENTRYEFRNVPALLEKNETVNSKLRIFLDTILNQIEKKRFSENLPNLSGYFDILKKQWEYDYSWIEMNIINTGKVDNFHVTADILDVIFENLILNSIQQNGSIEKLILTIEYGVTQDDEIFFKYHDNGKGLSSKYSNDPYRLLKVHETTRDNGHGLGMWLVNRTIDSQFGKITDIYSQSGFHIHFMFKGGNN